MIDFALKCHTYIYNTRPKKLPAHNNDDSKFSRRPIAELLAIGRRPIVDRKFGR